MDYGKGSRPLDHFILLQNLEIIKSTFGNQNTHHYNLDTQKDINANKVDEENVTLRNVNTREQKTDNEVG